jgi:hypothetical protein
MILDARIANRTPGAEIDGELSTNMACPNPLEGRGLSRFTIVFRERRRALGAPSQDCVWIREH